MLENLSVEESNSAYISQYNRHLANKHANKIHAKVKALVNKGTWSSWKEEDREELTLEATRKIYNDDHPPFEDDGNLTIRAITIIKNCRTDYYRKHLRKQFAVEKLIRTYTYFDLFDRYPNKHASLFSDDHYNGDVGQEVEEADYASSDIQLMDDSPPDELSSDPDDIELGKDLYSAAIFSRDSHSWSPSEDLECDQLWERILLEWQAIEPGANKDVFGCYLEGEHDRHEIAARTGRKLASVDKAKTFCKKMYKDLASQRKLAL